MLLHLLVNYDKLLLGFKFFKQYFSSQKRTYGGHILLHLTCTVAKYDPIKIVLRQNVHFAVWTFQLFKTA